ncbi:MAG: heme-binding protein [Candidatus Dormibacteraceae bacterium]
MPQVPLFHASAPAAETLLDLGPLQQLPGTWIGNGFNLIARPDKQDNKPFFLELNATREIINFTQIGAPIPNRGSIQGDIEFLGVHYLQQISDVANNGALHLEPGIWLNIPALTAPTVPPSVVRLATVPHGHSLLAQGESFTVSGGPQIASVSSTPINHVPGQPVGQPITDPTYLAPFGNTTLPPGIPAASIANPNLVLTEAIKEQTITQTVVLPIDTTTALGGSPGGIENIPFLVTNANATSMSAIFWIETVQPSNGGGEFLQLQYTQTVILNFLDIDWPHISVATLIKQ